MKDKSILKVAEFKDIPKMLSLLKRASKENPIKDFPDLVENDTALWMTRIITAPQSYICNAYIDNRLAGTMALRAVPWPWDCSKRFLQSEWFGALDALRKHNIAGRLVDQAKEVAKSHKLDLLFNGILYLKDASRLLEDKGLQFRGGFHILPYQDPLNPASVKRNPPRTLSEAISEDEPKEKTAHELSNRRANIASIRGS